MSRQPRREVTQLFRAAFGRLLKPVQAHGKDAEGTKESRPSAPEPRRVRARWSPRGLSMPANLSLR
jgi:hypothetical protein